MTDGSDPVAGHDDWWRDAVVYQVYPKSFADSDGDGTGDLPGVTSRLDYLRDLGVDAIWLSPFYVSPQNDGGYDVADYRAVDPRFGDLSDVEDLLQQSAARGLKVIVDLVPNHSSDQHPWFQEALAAGPGSAERARYIFREGRGAHGELPPNNWRSVFGGDAWTRVPDPDGAPGQWYLHLFDVTQPDFDWTNEQVRAEFRSILRFWLDRGVSGFRIDVAHGLIKAEGLPDATGEQRVLGGMDATNPVTTHLTPYWDQDGVHEVYRDWRALVDEVPGPSRVLCGEAWVWPPERMALYLRPDELHQTFTFDLLESPWRASRLRRAIDLSLDSMGDVGASCTWVLSNHDVVRHATRYGLDQDLPRPHGIRATDPQPDVELGQRRARAAALMLLALPGSAYLYQGDELGLTDHTALPDEVREDPAFLRTGGAEVGRDGCRIPMPWSAQGDSLGFSPTGARWLPQPADYRERAVDQQLGVSSSMLELHRHLLRLRRRLGLGRARLSWTDHGEDVLAWRMDTGGGVVEVIVNTGPTEVALPAGCTVLASSAPVRAVVGTDEAVWFSR